MSRRLVPLLWVGAVAVLLGFGPSGRDLTRAADGDSWVNDRPDAVLAVATGGMAWLVLLWLALGYLAVLGTRCAGRTGRWSRRTAQALLPQVLQRALESAVGVSVALVTATPALAATTPVASTAVAAPTVTIASPSSRPLPSLDRPATTTIELAPLPAVPAPVLAPAPVAAPPDPAPTTAPSDPVLRGRLPGRPDATVVRRGDCLWSVVARALGPAASDADVARAWPRWYAANRSVIGPDPDLLLPGQRLSPPDDSTSGG